MPKNLKNNREFITNVIPGGKAIKHPISNYITYKRAKKNQKSFRITNKLLQGVWNHALKIKKQAQLIISIPANQRENFIITCSIRKERKV